MFDPGSLEVQVELSAAESKTLFPVICFKRAAMNVKLSKVGVLFFVFFKRIQR